jgi:hypothetical protein
VSARLGLKPGEACQPPPAVFGAILEGLTRGELETMMIDFSVSCPEAFEEALHTVQRVRNRRAALAGGAR